MANKPRFDPYELLSALERRRVTYIVIGGFARVIQGADEMTEGIDIVPSMRDDNLNRLGQALVDLGAERVDGQGDRGLAREAARGTGARRSHRARRVEGRSRAGRHARLR